MKYILYIITLWFKVLNFSNPTPTVHTAQSRLGFGSTGDRHGHCTVHSPPAPKRDSLLDSRSFQQVHSALCNKRKPSLLLHQQRIKSRLAIFCTTSRFFSNKYRRKNR